MVATGVSADGDRSSPRPGLGRSGHLRRARRAGRRDRRALPLASWQRWRTHCAANLMSVTPKTSRPWVKALLHSVYDQQAESVHAQVDRIIDALHADSSAAGPVRPSDTTASPTPSHHAPGLT